jgi:regulator of replication initiation timing
MSDKEELSLNNIRDIIRSLRSDLSSDLEDLRSDFNNKLETIEKQLGTVSQDTGDMKGRMDEFEKQQNYTTLLIQNQHINRPVTEFQHIPSSYGDRKIREIEAKLNEDPSQK